MYENKHDVGKYDSLNLVAYLVCNRVISVGALSLTPFAPLGWGQLAAGRASLLGIRLSERI